MKQKTKTHKSSTLSFHQAQQNLASAMAAVACHSDASPETVAWLKHLIEMLEKRAQPSATSTQDTLRDYDYIRLTDATLMVMASESTDSEIAQALAHLLFTIRQQKGVGAQDAMDWCISRCYAWSNDFNHRSRAFAEYKLTMEA